MANWNEIHTAAHVARLGTVSAAAEQLGIHRATVIRHIDQLEQHFGSKLFIRARNGYTATDLGQELLRVADLADSQFAELKRAVNTQPDNLRGELIIATLDLLVPDLLPSVEQFALDHPDMRIRLVTGEALTKLEYGEADIAFRVGAKPDHPDHVVAPFLSKSLGLFAAQRYVQRHGTPSTAADFNGHHFVSSANPNHLESPFLRWMEKKVPEPQIRFRFNNFEAAERATVAGLGIGFIPHSVARQHDGMVEVIPPLKAWSVRSWRLTHVDVHRSEKVRAFLTALQSVHATTR